MHSFTSIAAATALFSCVAHGLPIFSSRSAPLETREKCLTTADAAYLVNGFALLVNSTFNDVLAADIIASDFTDYSDSIDFLSGAPLSTATFTSLEAFEAAQSQQPPIPLQVLSIDAVSCTNIAWRWLAYPGSGLYEVKGINIIYAVQGTGSAHGWQIGTNFAEFNSAAWTLDLGATCLAPTAPATMFKKKI